ncbi:hypothetical protein G7Y89_g14293 [Cudoniella acicularis]|uniref:Enoyl reductase (ER) domain-containing protein n=1 Tax=Cudoniella acicularis TaxID=354080 RepID=A0A8H4R6Q7_9HELO|nr:hypothetical protein G7Y89_g14293 [Cudoniella acicularis]
MSNQAQNIAAVLETRHARVKIVNRAIPKPGPDELVVRNRAVATNPADWMIQDYGVLVEKYPTVLGSDSCGTVTEVGSSVTKFKVGDRVTGFAGVIYNSDINHGAWQTYTVLREIACTKIPDSMTFEEGSVFPMAMATSAVTIFANMGIPRPTKPVPTQEFGFFIWGASSSVGVSAFFDYHDPKVVENVVEAAKLAGTPIRFGFDTITKGTTSKQSADVLIASGGPGSKLVLVLDWSGKEAKPEGVDISQTAALRTGTDLPELGSWLFNDFLQSALEDGSIVSAPKIEIVEGGIESAQKAFDMSKAGVSGKKMALFALPLSTATQATISRVHFPTRPPSRKRKRAASDSSENEDAELYNRGDANNLPAALTNPLSLTPNEIAQYRLAGLSLDEELPDSKGIGEWPHRGLPVERDFFESQRRRKNKKGKEKAIEDTDEDEEGHHSEAHLGVLTTILHRCLLENDIPRASKAWALLLREEVGGSPIDIKSTGYWGIGAELLVKSFDRTSRHKLHRISDPEDDSEEEWEANLTHGNLTNEDASGGETSINDEHKIHQRWGTKEGLKKAKSYYEWLVVQFPYKRQYHNYVSAVDFFPAMLSCEVYGIQCEHCSALQKIPDTSEIDSGEENEENSSGSEGFENSGSHFGFSGKFDPSNPNGSKQNSDKRRLYAQKIWTQRDKIRRTALIAAEAVATRMSQLIEGVLFSQNHELLRLRGMLALYIGDLSVPEMPVDQGDFDGADADTRYLHRRRVNEHEQGKQKREEEQGIAREMFTKSKECGGDSVDLKELSSVQDEAEDSQSIYDSDG